MSSNGKFSRIFVVKNNKKADKADDKKHSPIIYPEFERLKEFTKNDVYIKFFSDMSVGCVKGFDYTNNVLRYTKDKTIAPVNIEEDESDIERFKNVKNFLQNCGFYENDVEDNQVYIKRELPDPLWSSIKNQKTQADMIKNFVNDKLNNLNEDVRDSTTMTLYSLIRDKKIAGTRIEVDREKILSISSLSFDDEGNIIY